MLKRFLKTTAAAFALIASFYVGYTGSVIARDIKIDASNPIEIRAILTSIYTDLSALLTPVDALVTDYTAGRAEIIKLVTDITAADAFTDSLRTYLASDGIINTTTLSVGSNTAQVANTAFQYLIDGVPYHKAAVTAGTAFSAADTINTGAAAGFYWGIWAVQIDAAGTISTKSPSSDQVYADEATAIAALPAADAGSVVVGYVTVKSLENVDWVAQTDDLTDASDCTEANFYSTASGIPAALVRTATNPAAVTASAVGTLTTTND